MKNMKAWVKELPQMKKALPILSFPSISLLNVSVRELIGDSDLQAKGMQMIAEKTDSAASVSLMDLSVEAECFGAQVRFSDDEVPTVTGRLINDMEEAEALEVPAVGAARSGLYVDSIRKAAKLINDRPVFAGIIGPFSLAARLLDVSEIMMDCYDDPDMVHLVLRKCTDFLIAYAKAYKEAGADGVMMAEPVAGLLSPSLEAEFSAPYVKEIVDAVQDDDFALVYHNCGDNVLAMTDSIIGIGAALLLNHYGLLSCGTGEIATMIALFGAPAAVSSVVMAGQMGSDEQLATQHLVWSSIGSVLTIFLQVCILMAAGILVI